MTTYPLAPISNRTTDNSVRHGASSSANVKVKVNVNVNAKASANGRGTLNRRLLPILVSGLFSCAVLGLGLHVGSAIAVSLGEPTLRSFLGESLDVSLPLLSSADDVDVDISCFQLQRVAGDETYLHGREIKLTVAETRGSKRLRLQSLGPVSEPVVKLRMRATCGSGTVVRDYALLLDPSPLSSGALITPPNTVLAPTVAATALTSPGQSSATDRSPGVWVARAGDSMQGIATGLFPKSKRNQGRYVTALRNTNPSIAGLAAKAPLPPGTNIALPDLRSLPKNSTKNSTKIPALELPEKPTNRASSSIPATEKAPSANVANAEVPPLNPARKPKSQRTAADKAAQAQSGKPQATKASGFSLKLSGGDVDTSRSAGVTEEVRAGMRQKQLLLDADDQVAALLTLSNSVKRLEKRLDVMQGRPAGSTQAENAALNTVPSAVPNLAPTAAQNASALPAPTVAATSDVKTVDPLLAPASTALTSATTPADAKKTEPVAKPANIAKPNASAPKPPSIADDILDNWPLWLSGIGIALGLAALVQMTRRRKAITPTYRIEENTLLRPGAQDDAKLNLDAFNTNHDAGAAPAGTGQVASLEARRQSAETLLKRSTSASVINPAAANTDAGAGAGAAIDTDADHDAASDVAFDLDPKPARSNTALLSRGLNSPENRVRRLKYMAERFPELGSGTVSIDDSVSVINAARLYYDEKQADKAIELLTFGVEERPQQLSLWLALFEVYRLENMAAPFTELATKFHVLFAASPEWPKVRHIGYELNPYEPLFAEAVEGVLMGDSPFDSMQDNWLNAPIDMSSHFFAQQLRQSLFAEFNVLPNQLDFSPNVIEVAGA